MAKVVKDVQKLFDAGKIAEAGALARQCGATEQEKIRAILPALLPDIEKPDKT